MCALWRPDIDIGNFARGAPFFGVFDRQLRSGNAERCPQDAEDAKAVVLAAKTVVFDA
jgi:hypothetical protein